MVYHSGQTPKRTDTRSRRVRPQWRRTTPRTDKSVSRERPQWRRTTPRTDKGLSRGREVRYVTSTKSRSCGSESRFWRTSCWTSGSSWMCSMMRSVICAQQGRTGLTRERVVGLSRYRSLAHSMHSLSSGPILSSSRKPIPCLISHLPRDLTPNYQYTHALHAALPGREMTSWTLPCCARRRGWTGWHAACAPVVLAAPR